MSKICTVTTDWRGAACKDAFHKFAEELVWLAAQDAITQSVNEAPIDTGTLRRSGVVTMSELPNAKEIYDTAQHGKPNDDRHATGIGNPVAYASYSTPYALKLHENTNWTPRNGGGPKWLEKVIPLIKANWNKYVQRARRKAGL